MNISISAARNVHLAAQGLLTSPKRIADKSDVLDCIRRMCLLQIDTIHVVARSPYLVLWSRLGDYPQAWLEEHLEEKQLFEYWAHEACFIPIENFGRYRHQMLKPEGMSWRFNAAWLRENASNVRQVLAHIKDHGACRSADFERRQSKGDGWWDWKPEKRALEVLFSSGKVMVARRQKFQRVYDLTERVHPLWDDKRDLGAASDYQREQVLDAVRALGVTKASWIADYFRMKKLPPALQPETLVKKGLLFKIEVEGWTEAAYFHPDHLELLEQAQQGKLHATHTCLLSPFDPVVWDRKRALELFEFDYRIECYTPAEKRQFGYFSLPILRRGKLIGRLDAKAHRKEGQMEVKGLFLEAGIKPSDALSKDLAKSLQCFAGWHGTPEVLISACENRELGIALKSALKQNPFKPSPD